MKIELELHSPISPGLQQIIEDAARLSMDAEDCCRSIFQIAIVIAAQLPLETRRSVSQFLRQEASWLELREQ
jgi:hypothetical protein